PAPSALPRWRGRHSPTEASCFLDLVSPREFGATAGNEQQRGTTDADEIIGLELGRAQDGVPAKAHQVRLAATLQIAAALFLIVGDERVLLARDRLVPKAQTNSLIEVPANRVHSDEDRAKVAAPRTPHRHHPTGDGVAVDAWAVDVLCLGLRHIHGRRGPGHTASC